MKVRKIYWLIPLVVLGAAMWSWGTKGETKREKADSTAVAAADSALADSVERRTGTVLVETKPAVKGSISSYLNFKSTVETEAAVEIYPRVGGSVERVAVEEGDRVEAGDALLYIDADRLRIAAREAELELKHQEAGYERTEEMFRRKLISKQEFENKQFELDQARLRWKRAALELEHAVIRAPFAGVITERHVQVGSRVGENTQLMALVKLDDMIARVHVPGQHLPTIDEDQEAQVVSDFLGDRQFEGWVKRISPVVNAKNGTFKVTIGLRDRFEFLRPGVFVDVRIITDTHAETVLVPRQAIVYDRGERYVFVIADGKANRVKLETGFENEEYVEALSAIESGMEVIVVGQNGLKDKTRVALDGREA